jgi:hypothetical protein
MSRRSTLKRRRERQRRKHAQRKLTLQLPVLRKVSTADLFAEIERRTQALAYIFEGKY